jgi:transcriptional regulator with XRE-family HTH domain
VIGQPEPSETLSERLLSTSETAVILGVLPKTVNQWALRGFLTGQQFGGRRAWLFPESSVRALVGKKPDRRRSPADTVSVRVERLHRFTKALNQALERSGLTLRATARAAGLPRGTIQSWLSGRKTPYRENLTRLAEIVGEPALLDLIETRHRTIKLVCRDCGNERDEQPGRVRIFEKERDSDRFSVDWKQGTATHVCHSCWGREMQKAEIDKVIKREGHEGLRKRANGLVRFQEQLTPKELHDRAVVASAAAAATAHLRRPTTDLEMARNRLYRLAVKVKGTISLCPICQLIVYTPDANSRWRREHGRRITGNFHVACLAQWTEGRAWVVACKKAHQEGRPPPSPPALPRKANHPVSDVWLADAYMTVVRYFRQHERIRRRKDGRVPRSITITALARELGIATRTLHQRVDRFLSYLPDESAAVGVVKIWREVFLTLEADLPQPAHLVRKTSARSS